MRAPLPNAGLASSVLEPLAKGFAAVPSLDTRVRELERFQQQQHRKVPASAGAGVALADAGEVELERRATPSPGELPSQFRARVVPAGGSEGEIQRLGSLTRESVQALLDDSRLVGRGARLEILLLEPAAGANRGWLDGLARAVRRHGVSFHLRAESDHASWRPSAARAAA